MGEEQGGKKSIVSIRALQFITLSVLYGEISKLGPDRLALSVPELHSWREALWWQRTL